MDMLLSMHAITNAECEHHSCNAYLSRNDRSPTKPSYLQSDSMFDKVYKSPPQAPPQMLCMSVVQDTQFGALLPVVAYRTHGQTYSTPDHTLIQMTAAPLLGPSHRLVSLGRWRHDFSKTAPPPRPVTPHQEPPRLGASRTPPWIGVGRRQRSPPPPPE